MKLLLLTLANLLYTNNGLGGCLIEGEVMGVITGTYDECGGTLTQTWTFTDSCNRTSTQYQTITVEPAPQAQFPAVEPINISCDEASTYIPDTLIYTNNGLGGCLIEGLAVGLITGSYDECGGTLTQTWTYTDNCNRTSTQIQTITVEQSPQAEFTHVDSLTIGCNEATTFTPGLLLYSNYGLGGCLIEGQAMGVISGNYNECGGELIQNWTFTDNCGRISTREQVITVDPAPEADWLNPPADINISCDQVINIQPGLLYYSNNAFSGCLIDGSVMGQITGDYNNCNGLLVQQWTFTDNCGRTIEYFQSINISDDEPPEIIPGQIDFCFSSEEDAIAAALAATTITDNCTNPDDIYIEAVVSGTCDAIVTITATDLCDNAASITYNTRIDAEAPVIICPEAEINCAVTSLPPYGSLQEFLDAGGTVNDNCGIDESSFVLLNEQINGAYPAAYTISRTYGIADSCGNQSACDQFINVPSLLIADIIPDNPLICEDGSFSLNGNPSGGDGSYSHSWSGTGAIFLSQANIQNPDFSGAPAGSYTLVYTVTDGEGCIASDQITASVDPAPDVFAGQDQTIPYGTSTTIGDATASGTGPLTYSWTPANLLLDPTVLHPTTVDLTAMTTLTLTVTDNIGCQNSDEMKIFMLGGPLTVDPTAIPDEICVGETSQLFANASGGSGVYTYSWISDPPGFTSNEENPFVSPLFTTIYTVVVDDGINTASGSVTVTVYPLPVFDCPQYGPVCEGSAIILFTEPGMFRQNGAVVTQFNPITAGNFTFSYTETTAHGCSDSCEFSILVNPLPEVFAGQDQTILYGTSTTIGDATASGAQPMTYSWTPANLLLDPNVLNPTTINLNSNASFILTSIDANGCENSDEVTIFMQGGPLTINITAVPDEICVGETSQLFANASGGSGVYTYSWTSDPPGIYIG